MRRGSINVCQIITYEKALCCSCKSIFSTTVSSNLQGTSSIILHSIHIVSRDPYRVIASSVQSQTYYLAAVNVNTAMGCKTIRFQFIIPVNVPTVVWPWTSVNSSLELRPSPSIAPLRVHSCKHVAIACLET